MRILEVEHFELDDTQAPDADVDATAGPGFGLEVRGSVPAGKLPLTRVDLVQDAMALWEIKPSREGTQQAQRFAFYAPVGALPLPLDFEIVVRAQLGEGEEGTRVRLASVRGSRAVLHTGFEPQINPLMVTTFSRTGSNLLLRMLGEHPEIVAYRPFQYEPRVSAYWVEVLRELAEPAGYRRQITPQLRQPSRGWWLGLGSQAPEPIADAEVEAALGLEAVKDLAGFCQARIDAVYGRIATVSARPNAAFFAEKHSPNEVPMILGELYPRAREIFLVRDFRDMIASMLAADARRGGVRFGRGEADTDEDFVRRFRRFATNLAASWRRRRDGAQLVRYEDLLQRPRETVAGLVAYLGLETTDATLTAMADSLRLREEGLEGHITSGSPEASIGRWRSDLEPELQRLADEVFGPALGLFGYERAERAA